MKGSDILMVVVAGAILYVVYNFYKLSTAVQSAANIPASIISTVSNAVSGTVQSAAGQLISGSTKFQSELVTGATGAVTVASQDAVSVANSIGSELNQIGSGFANLLDTNPILGPLASFVGASPRTTIMVPQHGGGGGIHVAAIAQ